MSSADDAGPPSPAEPFRPVPATVVMIPEGDTRRTRWFPRSAMNTLPAASTATLNGRLTRAYSPGPPSPRMPACPSPAMVAITPAGEILRTR